MRRANLLRKFAKIALYVTLIDFNPDITATTRVFMLKNEQSQENIKLGLIELFKHSLLMKTLQKHQRERLSQWAKRKKCSEL